MKKTANSKQNIISCLRSLRRLRLIEAQHRPPSLLPSPLSQVTQTLQILSVKYRIGLLKPLSLNGSQTLKDYFIFIVFSIDTATFETQ